NTVIGNRNRLRAAEGSMATDAFGDDFARLLPVNTPGGSDSAGLDEVLELLHLSGRSLAHALMMLIPEPWGTTPRWIRTCGPSTSTTRRSRSRGTDRPPWSSPTGRRWGRAWSATGCARCGTG